MKHVSLYLALFISFFALTNLVPGAGAYVISGGPGAQCVVLGINALIALVPTHLIFKTFSR